MTNTTLEFTRREQLAAARLIDMALMEDLGDVGDLTCQVLIDPSLQATVNVVARKDGVLSGGPIGQMVFNRLEPSIVWDQRIDDGQPLQRGDIIAAVTGRLDYLLIGERTMLNFLTHLSGIATLTRKYVDVVAGTNACILDTRKTHPGYRVLEKYAVRCGGGTNHRMGLYDGVLIKDNHLASWTAAESIAAAVMTAREKSPPGVSIEIEVDTLDQLRDVLQGRPDIVLLDNMTLAQLREAVAIRDGLPPGDSSGAKTIQLEASGGVTLETLRAIAETGVERISVGALTHSAIALDIAFDWSAALRE